jgi:D-serine deaminase-like pyridoxal phosphate-dependent protein
MAGEAATRAGIDFSVLIEIDVDGHRSGVSPQSEVLRPLARAVAGMPGLQLRGLLTHAGSAYDCESGPGIEEVAERERLLMVGAATVLRDSGIPCREVSVGSTPTALMARSYAGVTEVRAGVFVFNDLMQVRLGLCTMQDIAMSVLCSVIGHQETHHRVIVDAGWTALSQDRQVHGATLIYGLLCDLEGRVMDDLAMTRLNQEHGIVTRPSGAPINSAEFPIGRNLRILPVHACATAAAHDRYHLIPEGAEGIDIWPRFGRWTQ